MVDRLKKYFIKTYGCQMNVADSERIAGWYEEKGWKRAKKVEEADEIVMVSCSVRESADNRVFGLVNNLSKIKGQAKFKIILTGCMLRYPLKYLREKLPAVDEFKRIKEYRVQSTKHIVRNFQKQIFVPIMEGCDNFCSYCVVPYARGREKSRPFEEIVCEVKNLAERGYREITLLGQNVNSYGKGNVQCKMPACWRGRYNAKFKTPFAQLLSVLHEIEGINKISFLTSNPWDLDEEIIEAMKLPKIDRYLHLPIQSGDDEILKKMNRKYTGGKYLNLVRKIRKKIPEIKIGTDIIVGFPDETEKQFQHTVQMCQKVGFVKAYVAMYSPRSQTSAYQLPDNVPVKEKKRRWKILDSLINKRTTS